MTRLCGHRLFIFAANGQDPMMCCLDYLLIFIASGHRLPKVESFRCFFSDVNMARQTHAPLSFVFLNHLCGCASNKFFFRFYPWLPACFRCSSFPLPPTPLVVCMFQLLFHCLKVLQCPWLYACTSVSPPVDTQGTSTGNASLIVQSFSQPSLLLP